MIITALILIPLLSCLTVTVLNVLWWPKVRQSVRPRPRNVSVLIPARNEETRIAACLDAVRQQGEAVAEVIVYDDHSSDRTAAIVSAYTARDERLRLLPAVTLEPGWGGKNFACAQLSAAAQGEWLLFIDADAQLMDGAVNRMVEEAEARELTMLSCWPGLEMQSFWEKTLMPLLNFAVFTLYPAPLAMSRLQQASLGLAHGACLLFERTAYESFGGHAMVRAEIFEDTMLARLWRASGRRGLGLDGQDVVRVRMYCSFSEIRRGFQKNFYPAFRRDASFWLFLALHAMVFLLPFLLLPFTQAGSNLLLAAAGVVLIRLLLAWRFHHPLWSVALHPISEVVLILIGLSSWWRCRSGKGVIWKDRRYFAAAGSQK